MHWNELIDTSLDAIRVLILPLFGVIIWLGRLQYTQSARLQRLETLQITQQQYQDLKDAYIRQDERMQNMQEDIREIKDILKHNR